MITADEAAKQSMLVIYKHETEELKRIEDGIKSRIALGEREYNYDGYISQNAKKEMERCGFSVETGSQYNQGYVVIKW